MAGAARYTFGIEPVWPPELHEKTSYSAIDIADLVSGIVAVFFRYEKLPQKERTAVALILDTVLEFAVVSIVLSLFRGNIEHAQFCLF